MKNLLLIMIAILGTLSSCKKEETSTPTPVKYSFKNQVLQGKIGNAAWAFQSGVVEENPNNGATSDLLFYDSALNDACDPFSRPVKDFIFFSDPNLKVGLYELGEQSISLYDRESNATIIALEGAYEILSIDTINNTVAGRMDARFDEENFVNGSFTLSLCK